MGIDVDVASLEDERLQNLIWNHEQKRAFAAPLYRAAVREWNRRKGGGLDLHRTINLIWRRARDGRFLAYKDIADAHDIPWEKARYPVIEHLGQVIKEAQHHGWPMLSAVVVNRSNLATGRMDPDTLAGFINAAEWLGYSVADPGEFLSDQQEQVFAWARALTEPPFEA